MNQINIIGRIGKDPESRTTTSGKQVASFSVAVNRKFKNQDGEYDSDWFNVTVWGAQSEYVMNYLGKGRLVAVSGRMESRKHEDKTYWDLVADNVQSLDRPREDS